MKNSNKIVWVLTAATLTLGCGEWVQYNGQAGAGPGLSTQVGTFPKDGTLAHEALSGLMSRYLSVTADKKYALLDYDGILNSEDRYQLKAALVMSAEVDPSKLKDRAERLAYWINGYNAAVVEGVLRSYMADSSFKVTDSGTFFDSVAFGFTFGGVLLTLNQVENGVLRGVWTHAGVKVASEAAVAKMKTWHQELWGGGKVDARFHAAVNCAALGCPNLPATAPYVFRAATLDAQLKAAVTHWLDNAEKGAGASGISKLFDWYKDDFVQDAGDVEAFIKAHRTGGVTGVKLDTYLSYDWTLNHKANKK